ncbi:MAG: hypothetical protein JWM19_2597 [Actinomycetia bacterium]|nr:hypothetical protein [Actinomycetes bacterium]
MIKLPKEPARASLSEPRPISPEFLENHNRQASGMPPAGAIPDWHFEDVPAVRDVKPNIHVANAAVGGEITSLKLRLRHAERAFEYESSRPLPAPGPYSQMDYFIASRQGMVDGIASLRADIARMESLTPAECVDWAYERGWR